MVGVKYCKKCDRTYPEDKKFCSDCGKNLVELIEKPIKEAKVLVHREAYIPWTKIILIVIVIGLVVLLGNLTGMIALPTMDSLTEIIPRIKSCPYECCPKGEYNAKSCQADYECVNNKCVAIDSDNDGLTDIEERQLGTNSNLADSDGDGLNDYQEVKVYNSAPLRMNSDCDRYNDGEEVQKGLNLNTPNSAKLNAQITNKNLNKEDIIWSLLSTVFGFDETILSPTISYSVTNIGDDYTSYANFNIQLKMFGQNIDSHLVQLPRIDKGQTISGTEKFEVKKKQLPEIVINLLKQFFGEENFDWDVTIQNLNYEEYTDCQPTITTIATATGITTQPTTPLATTMTAIMTTTPLTTTITPFTPTTIQATTTMTTTTTTTTLRCIPQLVGYECRVTEVWEKWQNSDCTYGYVLKENCAPQPCVDGACVTTTTLPSSQECPNIEINGSMVMGCHATCYFYDGSYYDYEPPRCWHRIPHPEYWCPSNQVCCEWVEIECPT